MRFLLAVLLDAVFIIHAFAQITVTTSDVRVVEAPPGSSVIGSVDSPKFLLLPESSKPGARWAIRLDYDGLQSPDPDIAATHFETRFPVPVTKIDSDTFLVFGTGQVEIDLIDWDARRRHRVIVEIQSDDDSPDDDDADDGGDDEDDDGEDDVTPPEPDVDVPDAYGIGPVAYKHAVRGDTSVRDQYVRVYRQAADFLYGNPTAKAIIPKGEPDWDNPARSVFAWMQQEESKIQCTTEEKCKAWTDWKKKVNEAFVESQKKTQGGYRMKDWYSALNETANALELVP